mmetsp:Transcript_19393/g.60723  ORF Transcript_19393/g.60723 Transcript_19393/m.60723 type:complete len:240 (+) Transcript_19393:599-1318(+)
MGRGEPGGSLRQEHQRRRDGGRSLPGGVRHVPPGAHADAHGGADGGADEGAGCRAAHDLPRLQQAQRVQLQASEPTAGLLGFARPGEMLRFGAPRLQRRGREMVPVVRRQGRRRGRGRGRTLSEVVQEEEKQGQELLQDPLRRRRRPPQDAGLPGAARRLPARGRARQDELDRRRAPLRQAGRPPGDGGRLRHLHVRRRARPRRRLPRALDRPQRPRGRGRVRVGRRGRRRRRRRRLRH